MAKKLWGGRFKKETDSDFFEFQKSIQYDCKLARYDIWHSLIHILALKKAGILTSEEWRRLNSALSDIEKEIKENKFRPSQESEDIHTEIQNRVEKKAGRLAEKLHTLRSRNDQVAFDEKNYCGFEGCNIAYCLSEVISALKYLSAKYKGLQIPGYTHTQRAQRIAFADYLAAFETMFGRDEERIDAFTAKVVPYIGSGAFKGTSLSKEYSAAAKEYLKKIPARYISLVKNAPDNVSDRDFIVEFLSVLSILQMHLSRFSEDMILFSTKEFNFVDLPEEFCTGSSLMPHKKNPDFLELVRGYTGRIYGNLTALLTTMKGLPLTYNRDMQLDKEPLFSSVGIIKDELKILAKFIKGIKLNEEIIRKALEDEGLYAVDLAEYLVKERRMPFSSAHKIVGKLIRYSEDNNCRIREMREDSLKEVSEYLDRKTIEKIFGA